MRWFYSNSESLDYSLNKLYAAMEISKQAVLQHFTRYDARMDYQGQLLQIIAKVRVNHPTMGVRTLYRFIQPEGLGRDQFEDFCHAHSLEIKKRRNYSRTTDSRGVKRFPNRLLDFAAQDCNQVWVSDITYYELNNKFYYITLIADQYSRFIKGFHVSESLRTVHTTVPAMKAALRHFKVTNKLIFHSDGGGQYYSDDFAAVIKGLPIVQSMAYEVYENPMAESLNHVIKNKYLKPWNPKTFEELEMFLARAVSLYNYEKPHSGLQNSTPASVEFSDTFTTNNQPRVRSHQRQTSKPTGRRAPRFRNNQPGLRCISAKYKLT
jgi:putative transposase